MRLKSQLRLTALGACHLQYSSSTTSQDNSPYGDNWNVLWLGHCGEVFPEQLEENASKPSTDPNFVSISRKYAIPTPQFHLQKMLAVSKTSLHIRTHAESISPVARSVRLLTRWIRKERGRPCSTSVLTIWLVHLIMRWQAL